MLPKPGNRPLSYRRQPTTPGDVFVGVVVLAVVLFSVVVILAEVDRWLSGG